MPQLPLSIGDEPGHQLDHHISVRIFLPVRDVESQLWTSGIIACLLQGLK